jgi:uncharacterized membrane protein (DUF2068 family)
MEALFQILKIFGIISVGALIIGVILVLYTLKEMIRVSNEQCRNHFD